MAEPASAESARVSVIVASRDRRPELARALASAEAQGPSPDAGLAPEAVELLAVDDASSDDTWAWLAREWLPAGRAGAPRRAALRAPRRLGPGGARNLGVREARGEVVVFLDSDCVAEPDWLAELLAPLGDPAVGAVGGAEVDDPEEPALARAVHFALTSRLTTGGIRGGEGARAGRYRPRSFSMAVRRDALERAGGFREMLQGEDVELSLRIEKLGYELAYAPAARVRHRRRRTWRAVFTQAFRMGRARPGLMRMDAGHVELIYLLPPVLVVFAGALALAAALVPAARPFAVGVVAIGVAYAAAVSFDAFRRTGDAVVALLAPIAFAAQQTAYGLGFLAAWLRPRGA